MTLLEASVAFGLRSALAPPSEPLDRAAFVRLRDEAVRLRTIGFLGAAVSSGTWASTPSQRDDVLARWRALQRRSLVLERELLHVAALLGARHIDFRVLKGPAVAHLDYPDASLRGFGDIDLLIRGCDIGTVITDLTVGRGGSRRYPEPRPGFDRRFGKGASIRLPNGSELDLHRTLALGPFGLTIDPDELFDRPDTFTLAGRHLPALSPEDRLLHACLHALLGSAHPQPVPLRDVAQLALRPGIDTERVLERAARWKVEVVVATALRQACDSLALLDRAPIIDWAGGYAATEQERRMLSVYRAGHRTSAGQALAGLRVLRGTRARLAYARAIVLPARHPDASTVQRWRRGVRSLRGRR